MSLAEMCSYSVVLVLAWMELIFIMAVSTRLCFGFVLKTMSITQGCLWYCWAALTQELRPFQLLIPPHQWVGCRYTKRWEGHSQAFNWPQGYSIAHDVMLSNKLEGRLLGRPLFRDWLGIGQLEVNNCFHLHHLSSLGFRSLHYFPLHLLVLLLLFLLNC